jgi:uncharacterized membrane protein HdeD (DUF308 family)
VFIPVPWWFYTLLAAVMIYSGIDTLSGDTEGKNTGPGWPMIIAGVGAVLIGLYNMGKNKDVED